MVNVKDFELDLDVIAHQYEDQCIWSEGSEALMGIQMLSVIFARQVELMKKYHAIEDLNGTHVPQPELHGNLDLREIQVRIKDMAQRTQEELNEAMGCLKNKPWKADFKPTDFDHFYEEIADTFHFFVELCIIAGLSAEDLFSFYMRKSEVNKFRQDSGY